MSFLDWPKCYSTNSLTFNLLKVLLLLKAPLKIILLPDHSIEKAHRIVRKIRICRICPEYAFFKNPQHLKKLVSLLLVIGDKAVILLITCFRIP